MSALAPQSPFDHKVFWLFFKNTSTMVTTAFCKILYNRRLTNLALDATIKSGK